MIIPEPCLLPYHPLPLKNESLPSYIFRLAQGNGYDPVQIFMRWITKCAVLQLDSRLIHATPGQIVPILHKVTAHSMESLYITMYHQFAPVILPPNISPAWWQSDTGQKLPYFESAKGRQHLLRREDHNGFCPICLQEATYQRLPWMLKRLILCPQHHCYLLEGCQQCGEQLTLPSIMSGQCMVCDFDLRASQVLSLPEDDLILQAQQCIYSWLIGQCAPVTLKLPQVPGQILLRILDGLQTVANLAGADWAGYYIPNHDPPDELYAALVKKGCAWASALRGLMNWPDGFFRFLDQYRFRPQSFPTNSLRALNVLYNTWIQRYWQHPEFDFLQEAFNQYLVQHFPPTRSLRHSARLQKYPELSQRFAYIDVRNAARMLNSSPPAIKAMVRDGLLDVYPERDESRPGIYLYRSQVETAILRQHEGFSKRVAAQKLGLNLPVVDKLLSAGLLHQTGTSPYVKQPVCLFQDEDIEAFQRCLANVVQLDPNATRGRIQLVRVVEMNGKVGLGIPQLIQRVLDGKLKAYHAHPRLFPLNDLCFDPTDIKGLVEQVKAENNWIGFLEVVDLLGITRRTLHYWMEQEILMPQTSFARAQYFSKTEVLQWQPRLMTSHEVAQLLCTDRGCLSLWVRTGYMEAVSHVGRFLFDRQHIEQWHQQYVTVGELKTLLYMNDFQVRELRANDVLQPVNTEHPRPWFYSRSKVICLQQRLTVGQKL